MSYMETYKEWCTNPYFDENTKAELAAIGDDAAEIEDRFYRQLEFGTGGLRGVIGAGTNRMNIYTAVSYTHLGKSGIVRSRQRRTTDWKGKRLSRRFTRILCLWISACRRWTDWR